MADIRRFFGPQSSKGNSTETKSAPAKQTEKSSVKKKEIAQKETKKQRGSKSSPNKDENGNEKASKKKVSDSKKSSKKKTDEEVIEIDDDSNPSLVVDDDSNPSLVVKKNVKDTSYSKKRTLDLSFSDEVDEEIKPVRGREKKRRKQVQAQSEEEDSDSNIKAGSRKKKKKGKKAKNAQRILDSDSEDENPIPKKQRKRKSEPIVYIGVSGDEEEEEKPKKTFMDNFMKSKSPSKLQAERSKGKPEPVKKKSVDLSDFFGSSTIHRVERKTAPAKTPKKSENKPAACNDIEMHSDDDFERTLDLLDEESGYTELKVPKETKASKAEDTSQSEEKPSLASKLSAKAKPVIKDSPADEDKKGPVLVPDTPVNKKTSPVKAKPQSKKSSGKHKMEITPPEKKLSTPPQKSSPASPVKKPSPQKADEDTPSAKKGGNYRAYLHRDGPRSLGAKEIPEGGDNCLEGMTFVITGVLESFERDETKTMIERYGGKVTGSISKKTSYIVLGRDPGESKIAKAETCKTKQLDEDALLDLIRKAPGKKSKYAIQAEESIKKENSMSKKTSEKFTEFQRKTPVKMESISPKKELSSSVSSQSHSQSQSPAKNRSQSDESLLWVDKYKPTSLKQIIGQQGDKSNCKKLFHWLTSWHKNQAAGVKPVTGKFFGGGGGRDDGAGFKAALLSGPPGIGKTTTAILVCKEAGFSYVELNASDTRNARSLKEVVSQALGNTSMVDYLGDKKNPGATQGLKHCMVMDEVDGMSGNEDRGGISELVHLVKQSKIPIICMCNDRNHTKMRTLSGHCFDLRFQKPRMEQIKGPMMTLIYKEGLTIPAPALNEIILAANQDIRQVIHNLCMWSASNKVVSYDQAKKDSQSAKKDMKIGPFDVCRKVFVGGEETSKMTLHDKSDLFFNDYSIAPLFVQENYIHVHPFKARGDPKRHLSLLARAADSICEGDLVEKVIRSKQSWSLLPTEAMYASVLPGEYMRGGIGQMIAFPGWLGKNSSTTKSERILQELRTHMRLKISGDKRSLNMDYLPYLRTSLTEPLVQQEAAGVKDVIQLMDEYDIIKEDFDNIMEISKWPNSKDPMSQLSSQTKAAFTRTYNKEVHMTPYAVGTVPKKKRGAAAVDPDGLLMAEGDEGTTLNEEEEEEEDAELDAMIKKKKKAPAKAKAKASDTKAKGKGKAPAKGGSKAKGKR